MPSTTISANTTPACTAEGNDPFATGLKLDCCSPFLQCLGSHNTDRQFYSCIPVDSVVACQWDNLACQGQFGNEECATCGERVAYLKGQGNSEELAKQQVAGEFFIQCGLLAPQNGDTQIQSEGYKLVWQDEFDTPGMVDKSKWYPIHSHGNGFGNEELQFYADREENAWISDGTLKIRARREDFGGRQYTSAKLESRTDWLYGKFHVRARLMYGKARGSWAANWMMPRDSRYGRWPRSGEIDIMEHVGYDPGNFHGTVHTQAYHHSIGTQIGGSVRADVDDWHTYTVEWRPEVILFACDGIVYQIYRKESDDADTWPFNHNFFLILNMAVGGLWGGSRGIDEDAFRGEGQIMEIDWVRVEQRPASAQSGPCTAAGDDPYASGSNVSCCSPLVERLGDHGTGNDQWFYKCVSAD